jgi:hypothetical protein
VGWPEVAIVVKDGAMSIGYQYQKLGAAVRALGSLTLPAETRVALAMGEFFTAYETGDKDKPPRSGEKYVERIREIMEGSGSWEQRASELDELELNDLSNAFFELEAIVGRAHFKSEQ